MNVNERLKELRRVTGLSLSKFAKRIAVSHSYIADMEHGKKPINERMIRLIATEFCVDVAWLRTGDGEMYSGQNNAKMSEVISTFKLLEPHYQELAIVHLNTLVEWQWKMRNETLAKSKELAE